MKTILITGGAGFIGSNFVKYLLGKYPDYKLLILDTLTYAGNMQNLPWNVNEDSRWTFWYGNIRNGELVDTLVSQSDIIVHFAAESHVTRSIYDNSLFFETDVLGTQTIANSVLKHRSNVERFIHISTSEVYGTAQKEFMDEEHNLVPLSPYAAAKVGADRLVYAYWATYGIPAVIIRPFNNYGPYQHLEKAIPRFITSAILNEPVTIHGDGLESRDWLYVENHCEALDKVIHCPLDKVKGQVINIGTGVDTEVITLARMILKKMGKPESLLTHIGDRPGQVNRHTSSTDKAARLLGFRAKTKLEEGLDKTIGWYVSNPDWWQPLRWMRQIPIVTKNGRKEMH